MAGRRQLTPETVVGRALVLADSVGLEGVTIRRLAKDLGVTPMALYWHFRNKDALLDAMMGRIFAEVDPALEDSATWVEQFRALMRSLAGALRAHPGVAPLFATRTNSSESSLRFTEVALDVLRRGGFSPVEATRVSRHALSTIVNLVVGEPGFISPEGSDEPLDARRRARLYLETLPPERYPRLVEAAVPLSAPEDPEAYYQFGLDLLLAGVEEMAARKAREPARGVRR
ncbi:MAG TPA: TetR/AcrR family transcriptional regulator C-terminal domain-containing protein [Rubrobacter sp.]|nr:TetR/AcrR family transcriptional regulator C-terminal domain-containing protein [Rubrobacter sp.]